jgi:hypothetical protein
MSTNEMRKLIEQAAAINNDIKAAVKECLVKLGATDEEHGVEFDWEDCSAPSICSLQFGDDVADSYITKIWYDKGLIKVNLHAYYVGDDRENIDLASECNVDYEDILDYLACELEERGL